MKQTTFIVNKQDLQEYQFVETPVATSDLADGQLLLKIDSFSFTSNNITYAMIGEQMRYWNFFPTKEGWGIIPVWGFAEVRISKHEKIKEGARFYGYFPTATHLVVDASKVQSFRFVDASTHRKELPPVYNYYTNTQKDALYTQESEHIQSLLRPLFVTSFLIDDFLVENNCFGATQLILTSASSKTALALAFLLHQRNQHHSADVQVIGLTSSGNVDFVNQSGFYDQVIAYDQLSNIQNDRPSLIVDFAGNHALQYNIQTHLKDQLTYNCTVGMVHWDQRAGDKPLPMRGSLFFAPTYAQKRQKDWGPVGFNQRLGSVWKDLLAGVAGWLSVHQQSGKEAMAEVYLNILNGKIDPKQGQILSL